MSKLIAIWGSPQSGKTTLAVKLAIELDNRKAGNILVLHTDNTTPAMPVLFPFERDIQSIGHALSAVDISPTDILQAAVVPKGRDNLGFLGYAYGDNQFSYPAFDKEKAVAFLSALKSLADYVIVDCSPQYNNVLSRAALSIADTTIKLAAPELKAISFFLSQTPLYVSPEYDLTEAVQGLTITQSGFFQPLEECREYFQNPAFLLPFCQQIQEQTLTGELMKEVHDKEYRRELAKALEQVMNHEA